MAATDGTAGGRPREGRAPEIFALLLVAALALSGPVTSAHGATLADACLLAGLLAAAASGRLRAPAGWGLAAAAACALASAVVAADRGAAVEWLAHAVRLLLAFWLGATVSADDAGRRRVAWTLAGLGAAAAAHAAVQLLVIHPRLAQEPGLSAAALSQLADRRANSVFLLPAHLGAFLAMSLAAATALATGERGRRRMAAVALGVACASGLALSASFGGLLLAAGAGSLLGGLLAPRAWRPRLVAAGVVATLVAGAAFAWTRGGEIRRESPWGARARNWATAARLSAEAPWLGHGPGSFAVEHARARSRESNDVRHAHQAFVEVAAELGLPAAALAGAFAALLVARALRGCGGESGRDRAVRCGLAAAATAAVAHGLIDFGWSEPGWALPASLVLGVAWGLPDLPGVATRRRVVLVGALGTLLLAADIPAGLAAHEGERALELGSEARHAEAREHLARARRLQPLSDRWAADGAGAALGLARAAASEAVRQAWLGEAEQLARRAVGLSPRKAARHALLAAVLDARGDAAGARDAARAARELAPHSELPLLPAP